MNYENYIQTLQDHILKLRSALFYDISESVLRLPPTVVHTLDVDEAGQIWFVMPRPTQELSEFGTSFPVQLNYFRKQSTCSVQIGGKGFIIHDPEDLYNWMLLHPELPQIGKGSVLIKVKILKAEVQEWADEDPSPLAKALNKILAWLHMLDEKRTTFSAPATFH